MMGHFPRGGNQAEVLGPVSGGTITLASECPLVDEALLRKVRSKERSGAVRSGRLAPGADGRRTPAPLLLLTCTGGS